MSWLRKDGEKLVEHRYQILFLLLASIPFILVFVSAIANGILSICVYDISSSELPAGAVASKKLSLLNDVEGLRKYASCLWTFNGYASALIKILAIQAALITTISSYKSWAAVGVISGAIVSAVAGIQVTFQFSDNLEFYRAIVGKSDTIHSDVRYATNDEAKLDQVRQAFQAIRLEAAGGPQARSIAVPSVTPTLVPTPVGQPSPTPALTSNGQPTPTPTLTSGGQPTPTPTVGG